MAPDPLRRILRRLDNEPPVFLADEATGDLGSHLDRLVGSGVLRETTPATAAACPECGNAHVRRVVPITDRQAGVKRVYLPCPDCGSVEISPDRLKRWTIDIGLLLNTVSVAAGLRGPATTIIPRYLWRLGKAAWGRRPREVFFARQVHGDNRPAIAAEVSRRPGSVLFVPTEETARDWRAESRNLIVALESAVSLGPESLSFDQSYVESRLTDAGLIDSPRKNRPPPKRQERAGKIERLTRELKEHLRSARNHAFSTRDRTGTPQLLPRPSQKELAERTGISASAVSRCLKDKEARELRLCWNTAIDLEQIMR
jgi:predicted RNA-binding Zn-ribbon protein involved in translation (DUF1610 family)